VGAGVKSAEEVDALAIYLFGDGPEGRAGIRSIDATFDELPGLDGLTLFEDVLDRALERAARSPGYAGTSPMPRDHTLAGAGPEAWSDAAAA
jgi:hypothetical protein